MRTETINVYRFAELSPKAQKKAMDKVRLDPYYIESDNITELMSERLKELGYGDCKDIQWSLGYCQGDGVAFYGKLSSDSLKNLSEKLVTPRSNLDMVYGAIDRGELEVFIEKTLMSHRYSHYGTMDVVYMAYEDVMSEACKTAVEDFVSEIEKDIKMVCGELEKLGYSEIEYLNSDECVSNYLLSIDEEIYREDGSVFTQGG